MNTSHRLHLTLVFLLALLFPMLLTAQGSPPEVRVVHLSPDAPRLDVKVLGSIPIASNLPFGSASETVGIVNEGTFPVTITPSDKPDEVLINAAIPLENNNRLNLILLDRLSTIKATLLDFDYTITAPPAKAFLRLLHASPDLGNVNVRIITSTGSNYTINNYQYERSTQFVEMPKGLTTIEISSAATQQLLIRVQSDLQGGTFYTAIFDDLAASLRVQLLNESSRSAQDPMITMQAPAIVPGRRLRLVHGLPAASPLDLYVDGVKVAAGISFRSASIALPVGSGPHAVAITPADAPVGSAYFSSTLTLSDGSVTTALALGNGPNTLSVLTLNRMVAPPVPAGRSSVRVVHGSRGLGAIDVRLRDTNGLVSDLDTLEFGVPAATFELAAGEFTVDIASPGKRTRYRARGTLPDASAVTILATGTFDDDLVLNMLIDSDTSLQSPMIALTPVEESPVRVVHLSLDAGAVDLYVDEESTPTDTLAYLEGSQWLDGFFPGVMNIGLTSRGGSTTILDHDMTVKENVLSTLYAVGSVGNATLSAVVLETPEDKLDGAGGGRSFLRLFNASPDAGTVGLELVLSDGTRIPYNALKFKDATEYIEAPSGQTHVLIGAGWPEPSAYMAVLPADAAMTIIIIDRVYALIESSPERQAPLFRLAQPASVLDETEMYEGAITILPNPVTGSSARITYVRNRSGVTRIDLYNLTGERVLSLDARTQSSGEHTLALPVESLPAGVYTVVVSEGDGTRSHGRLSVVR